MNNPAYAFRDSGFSGRLSSTGVTASLLSNNPFDRDDGPVEV